MNIHENHLDTEQAAVRQLYAQQRKLWDETPPQISRLSTTNSEHNLVTWLVDWQVVLETLNLTDRKTWYIYLGGQ
jgi:hypothetical protein